MNIPDDADGDAMRRVIEGGADLSRPMLVDFQIDRPDVAFAEAIAAKVPRGEFAVRVYQDPEDGAVTCECSREILLDHSELIRIRRQLTEIAEPFGAGVKRGARLGIRSAAACPQAIFALRLPRHFRHVIRFERSQGVL